VACRSEFLPDVEVVELLAQIGIPEDVQSELVEKATEDGFDLAAIIVAACESYVDPDFAPLTSSDHGVAPSGYTVARLPEGSQRW
jgi:hypothetical protein